LENLNVSIIQTSLYWQNRAANLAHFEKLMEQISKTNLIVLPEMFTSGFTMDTAHVADVSEGEVLQWMQKMAFKKDATVTGSIVIKENEKYYNRLLWVNPNGNYKYYDKRHLFRMANENEYYIEGKERLITNIENWRICPLICYDLRFPVWSRNINWKGKFEKSHQYDILIYVANWPERRSHAWKSLLVARAIENQCFVIGVNRIGADGNNINYSGDSVIINPLGEVITTTKSHEESVETISLNLKVLEEYRLSFPANNDADEYEIKADL
jgi:predicted amidohydrolase